MKKLAALKPELAITGLDYPMEGGELHEQLHRLAMQFNEMTVPTQARYLN